MTWKHTVVAGSRIVELGFALDDVMPRVSGVPPLVVATGVAHDDYRLDDGSSGCNETLLLGTHMGTHIDGFAHVSRSGLVHGGLATASVQTRRGVAAFDMTSVAPIVAPGILLDLPRQFGPGVLEEARAVRVEDLRHLESRDLAGAVIVLRTGWGRLWTDDPERYASLEERRPGFGADAATWLAARGVRAVGTDSFSLEVCEPRSVVPPAMPVHLELLLDRGVFIFEALNLEELAGTGQDEFLFVALPLRIAGATGSPVRPIAIL
jgi:kynurenine formamidase